MNRLDGKVALISGAAAPIGKAGGFDIFAEKQSGVVDHDVELAETADGSSTRRSCTGGSQSIAQVWRINASVGDDTSARSWRNSATISLSATRI